jgi:outer membrane protein insertion porin family
MTQPLISLMRLLTVCTLFVLTISSVQAQTMVREIQVEGAQRVEAQTVLSYMDLKLGDNVTAEELNGALKNLYSTGLFADVSLAQRGSTLVVNVVENPVINEIAFEGNEQIEDGQLRAEIQLRPRQVFTRTRVQSDVNRMYQVYRRNGRFSATIEPQIIQLDQNRINLVFEVDEGPVTKVESIRFVGNEKYDDDKLRSEVSTKEQAWYRFLSSDDRYDPDRLSFDQELLRRFYLSQGYADFRIISAVAELSKDRDVFYITMTVEEGDRYKVNAIAMNSALRDFDAESLRPSINIEEGDWYNADMVQENVEILTNELGDRQYAFVDVRPDLNKNRTERTIDLTFNISEAPPVFVERINVNGNSRTLDKVIRREMNVVEGDPFNRTKLAKSEQNIRNLNYFETVEVDVKKGSAPDKTVVDIDVQEKSTGELSIGAGFSTQDGPLADLSLRERNFLGKGQDLRFSTTIAGERTEFDVAFTEPHFLDRDIAAGFDLFHVTRDLQDESSYDQERSGAALRLGFPLSERWRQTWRYRFERNEITDVDNNASRFIREQEGVRNTSAISQRVAYDSRDSRISPTNGWMLWLDTEVAGLGGDAKYVSGRTGASYYYPIMDQWILNLLTEGGAIEGYGDENIAINERFFLGGTTLRGFERAGLGPRDLSTDDSLGGNIFYRGTAETSFPIGLSKELGIKGHLFSDAGTVFDLDDASGANIVDESSIRVSAGVGLSWRSPFGPIRVDFTQPILDEEYDKDEVFQFNFGTRF